MKKIILQVKKLSKRKKTLYGISFVSSALFFGFILVDSPIVVLFMFTAVSSALAAFTEISDAQLKE
jgi:hypothetical protein